MTTLAFIEREQGFVPCHIKEIKKDNVYYLVINGKRGQVHQAISDAVEDARLDAGWRVDGVLYE